METQVRLDFIRPYLEKRSLNMLQYLLTDFWRTGRSKSDARFMCLTSKMITLLKTPCVFFGVKIKFDALKGRV